jgi:hypothetical protein
MREQIRRVAAVAGGEGSAETLYVLMTAYVADEPAG